MMDNYVGNWPALSQKCYKSPYDVRQLSASAEKLSIRVCTCIKKVTKVKKKVMIDLGGD